MKAQSLGAAGNDGWCETWAWGGVSKHIGWRPPRLVASLSCYHFCSLVSSHLPCLLPHCHHLLHDTVDMRPWLPCGLLGFAGPITVYCNCAILLDLVLQAAPLLLVVHCQYSHSFQRKNRLSGKHPLPPFLPPGQCAHVNTQLLPVSHCSHLLHDAAWLKDLRAAMPCPVARYARTCISMSELPYLPCAPTAHAHPHPALCAAV
jgi:hypothetical protein